MGSAPFFSSCAHASSIILMSYILKAREGSKTAGIGTSPRNSVVSGIEEQGACMHTKHTCKRTIISVDGAIFVV